MKRANSNKIIVNNSWSAIKNKPVSFESSWGDISGTLSSQSDLQSALNLKAPLANPTFTGEVSAPTPITGDDSTKVATTEFVQDKIDSIIADIVETNTGLDDTLIVTPLQLQQLLDLSRLPYYGAVDDLYMPDFNITAARLKATTDAADGNLFISDNEGNLIPTPFNDKIDSIIADIVETNTGLDDTLIVTPLQLQQLLDLSRLPYYGAVDDLYMPDFNITAARLKATTDAADGNLFVSDNEGNLIPTPFNDIDFSSIIADIVETNTGLDDTLIVTPLQLQQLLDLSRLPYYGAVDDLYMPDFNITAKDLEIKGESYGLLVTKSYSFTSQGIGSGTYYAAGYYDAPLTDANLTQASLTHTFGVANVSYAAHAFIVAGGAGIVDTGVVGLKVTGTRIEDDGTRTVGYIDYISTDITTLSLNEYLEAVKYIGSVTFELYIVSGTPTVYLLDFNYGLVKYEDFGNHIFNVKGFECVGLAGSNDTSFNITVLHHDATSWIYSAAAFDPATGHTIVDLQLIHNTEYQLSNNEPFAFKVVPIVHADIIGSNSEGIIIKIETGANNSVQSMDMHLGVKYVK